MNRKTVADIARCIGGELLQSPHVDEPVRELAFDSRRIRQGGGTLFFALVSQRNDGHRYIGELYRKGVRHFVVNSEFDDMQSLVKVYDTIVFFFNILYVMFTFSNLNDLSCLHI